MNELKYIWSSIGSFILAYFAPIGGALMACGVLVAVDTITGVLASKKKRIILSSSMLYRIAPKLLVYNLLIITGFVIQKEMSVSWIPFLEISTGVIALIEFKSILENAAVILGKDVWAYIKDIVNKRGIDKQE
jgi:phage-related holin